MPYLSADAPRLSPAAREAFAGGVERLRLKLAGALTALGRRDPDCDAGSMLAELVGALALARAEPDRARSDAILARSRAALKARFGLEAAA